MSWLSWRDRLALVAGLAGPFVACAVLAPFRATVPNTDASLILVAVVVAVAANGHRLAGVLAALSAAASFDFFLTAPFHRLAIADRVDIETTILLLVVGAAVTELAVRGRRSRLLASTDEQFLEAIRSTSAVVGSGSGPRELTVHVTAQVRQLLGLRACRYEGRQYGGMPRLLPDGRIRAGRDYWDVEQYGLPGTEIELLVSMRGATQGRLVLTPNPGIAPTLPARRCATVLTEQLAAGLAGLRQPIG